MRISLNLYFRFLIIIIIALSCSCNITSKIADGEYLLNKYKLDIVADRQTKKEIKSIALSNFLTPKPNKRILGFLRFHLMLYNFGRDSAENSWFRRIGEPPVKFDSLSLTKNYVQLHQALDNKGYFNAEIKDTVIYKNKKANVIFHILPKTPYRILSIGYAIKDETMLSLIESDKQGSLLKPGNLVDAEVFDKERDRITALVRNQGYYYFSKDYSYFAIDSSLNKHEAAITIGINTNIPDSVNVNKRFKLNKIYIHTDYSTANDINQNNDTLQMGEYYIIYNQELKLKPQLLINALFLKGGDYFRINDVTLSYNKLTYLNVFKFINFQFTALKSDTSNLLDCNILLTPSSTQSFTIETGGTHTSGDLGVMGNVSYQNRNLLKGAEVLDIKLKTGAEVQRTAANTANELIPFNTFEFGPEARLKLPLFLAPIKSDYFNKLSNPSTIFTLLYNYQKRVDYERNLSLVSFGYNFNETKYKSHTFNPIEFNYVKIKPTASFIQQIDATKDAYIINNYTDHLTVNLRYTYIFNDQDRQKQGNFTFFRLNFESAGNLLRLYNYVNNNPLDSTNKYSLFGVHFSQFVKLDLDYRYYQNFRNNTKIVYRIMGGLGVPYQNSRTLPIEKSYFAGGANDIRAWQPRALGQGSYSGSNSISYDKTGDVKLEANIEYRFPIYKFLKGAFFVDAGNVWMYYKDVDKINANFDYNRFYKEIAIGSGVGARFDFSFFIIRLDAAIPLRNPSAAENNRWVKDLRTDNIVLNLGLGYPF